MSYVWLALIVIFGAVEVATVGLTSIWFALGAVAALISQVCGAPLWLQLVWFCVVSVATLILTRPLVKKYLNGRRKATNADRVLYMTGVVTEAIDNDLSQGAVRVDGKVWTARSDTGEVIPAGALVRPVSIEGVKLFVRPEPSEHPAETETDKT